MNPIKHVLTACLLSLIMILFFGCKNPGFIQDKEDDKSVFISAIVNQSLPLCDQLHAKKGDYSTEKCIRFLTNESKRGLIEQYNDCKNDLDCSTGGCSNEFCGAKIEVEDRSSDCVWEENFKCYRQTRCGCIDKHCDWIKTPEYAECLGKWV